MQDFKSFTLREEWYVLMKIFQESISLVIIFKEKVIYGILHKLDAF